MTSETAVRPPEAGAAGGQGPGARRWRPAVRWELGLVVLLVAVLVFGRATSEDFWTTSTLFYLGINIGYVAIMALPMTLVIMTGEIDLSVASMLGLSASTIGLLWHHGWSMWPAMAVALLVGVVGGALNGFLVAKVGLPSIAVTIGSLALFRGIAEIMLGSLVVPGIGDPQFPAGLTSIGVSPVVGTNLAWGFVVFLVLAVLFAVTLHATPLGRSLYAIGLQPEAAQFAGIRVGLVKFWLYVLTGLLSAFAGIVYTLQVSSVSYTAGTGLELNVVALVLFGGVSIFGGRGTIPGVVLAVLILGSLQMALTQQQVDPNVQNIITGVLLLLSVVLPNGGEAVRRLRARTRRSRPTSSDSTSSDSTSSDSTSSDSTSSDSTSSDSTSSGNTPGATSSPA